MPAAEKLAKRLGSKPKSARSNTDSKRNINEERNNARVVTVEEDLNPDRGVGRFDVLVRAFLDVWNCFLLYILAQMLGVLKRRLKPKRPNEKENGHNHRKNVHGKSEAIVPVDMARIASSQRQIHPIFEEKAHLLAYDDSVNSKKPVPTPSLRRSPDDPQPSQLLRLSRKSPVACSDVVHHSASAPGVLPSTPGSPPSTYHPAPNICVEGGRIEFIKSPSEGSALHVSTLENDKKLKQGTLYQSNGLPHRGSVGATTRAQQTQADIRDFVEAEEKCDIAKEFLEARIKELERLLEAEQRSGQRERLAVARLQRQLARREVIHRDVDRERRLRADTESRLRETVIESEHYRAALAGLQREFSRMEDTVRTMLQYKSKCEVLNQEKTSLATAYENRVHQFQNTISKLNQENESLRHQLRLLETTGTAEIQSTLLDRLRSLETENAHISRDADFQRKQYEKCLDDIANQVVRALLSQKGLREEIGNLQRRIKELENQNQALSSILVRNLEGSRSVGNALTDRSWFPGNYGSMASSEDCRSALRSPVERLLLPLQRPRSLNLYLHTSRVPVSSVTHCQNRRSRLNLVHLNQKNAVDEGNESPESGNKDEGYSTMSSDVQGPGDSNELSKRELEDLKEASDETDVVKLETGSTYASVVVVEDVSDPDIFFIPFNFRLAINPRHSYPPTKDFLPFQHIIRSFSDSHLCLKLSPNSPLLATPISPSVLFVDLIDKNHPLRRSKGTNSLLSKDEENLQEQEETRSSAGSWCSGAEGCWWDTEYIQHCLKLDDVRFRRDVLQYDNAELEDWSLSLSCEDIAKVEISTPGALPSIQEISNLTIDTKETGSWNSAQSIGSPGGSWSSVTSNNSDYCCHSLNEGCLNEFSKRSSVASDDAESPLVGTDFTRDFYRLVKFESTKSLASNSSRSVVNGDSNTKDTHGVRESALKNVLNFIAEQQQYCHTREEEDTVLHSSPSEQFKVGDEDPVNKLQDYPETSHQEAEEEANEEIPTVEEVPEVCDNSAESPTLTGSVTNYSQLMTISEEGTESPESPPSRESSKKHESLIPIPKPSSSQKPRVPQHRKTMQQKIRGTKIPVMHSRKSESSRKKTETTRARSPRETNIPVPASRKAETVKKVEVVANDLSFHKKATSKDVIDELNRMIRKGEEVTPGSSDGDMKPLDVACCCPTGWVHVERDIDFTDPKARANLLDVMLASSGSSGGSGSSSESGGDDPADYSHLHRIHRFRRQRKASATRKQLGVLRYPLACIRPSIIGRENFFVRFGDKEREAIATFDFLDELSTTSASGCSSCDTLGSSQNNTAKRSAEAEVPSPEMEVKTPVTPTTPITPVSPSEDSDERTGGQVSLSDSCANSFTESTGSLDDRS